MISTPIAVPSTLPTPPNSDVPPITTAATAWSWSFAPKSPLLAARRGQRALRRERPAPGRGGGRDRRHVAVRRCRQRARHRDRRADHREPLQRDDPDERPRLL